MKYGETGSTFYVIAKGEVDVYIPIENKIKLSSPELARLIIDYKHMIVEINGQKNFSCPFLQDHEREIFNTISLQNVLYKLYEPKIVGGKTGSINEINFISKSESVKYNLAMRIGSK